ncbi:hypothetical protein [Bradyrhizobium lablabi]|uniref:Uncharacterized protein n=1 Tax=Bradyrhizobium lablabi TaxID=722472 RepID=A0A1H5JJS3_9BRAD|nr:hypothetical protein [Bradyrhizobium lablabi]SEE52805.1 hypothetical protein SAMN05444171_7866 [Bradyrhizobium lablabi]SEE79103.1 hypothetical protein SAMN05444171_8071 [Bradyrhizobium lablabi]
MIGNCDCCDREQVPVSHFNATAAHPEGVACWICLGEDDIDPYGELSPKAPDDLLGEIWCTLNHARIFIISREKMHPDGVKLYDELRAKIGAIVAPGNASVTSQDRGAL